MTTYREGIVYGPTADEIDKPFDFKYYFYLLQKNLYIILTFFVIVMTLAFLYVSRMPDVYQATSQIIIERPQNPVAAEEGSLDDETGGWSEDYYKTQLEIMQGATVLRQVIQDLGLVEHFESDSIDSAVDLVRNKLTVKRIKESRLFNITFESGDPQIAANVANAIARAFIRKNFEDSLYYSRDLLQWLPQEGEDTDTITIQDPFGNVKQMTREELIDSLPTVQTDPTLRGLKERKNALESELKLLLRQYREKHPKIIKARATLKFLQESVEAEKGRIVEGLKAKARGTLKTSHGRVIEEAEPSPDPVGPNRLKILLLIAMAELFFSFVVIFLMDYFDDTIHSLEDLERRGIMLPFLGPIPLIKDSHLKKEEQPLVTYYDKKADISESFRYLRVAINFSASPESLKNLVVSSCLPSEGKSFISHNTAVSLALDGNKTLLVDADLRRPVVHRRFRVDNTTGLSNYLTSNVSLSAVVKESFVENLHLVASGPVSPNPAEILGSPRMQQFLMEARDSYDRIIIDCPPLTGLGDTYVLGSLVGHIIMVISATKTPSDLVKRTQQQLDKSGIKIIGVVLNQMDMEKERLGGYSKHYYHTYNRYYRRTN